MKKSLTSHIAAMALLLMAIVCLASCSESSSDLINYVPKDSKAVLVLKPQDLAAKGNLEKLIKQIPATKSDVKTLVGFVKKCLNGESGIDMEQVVVFEYENNAYISFVINDFDKFEKLDVIEDNFSKTKINGFEAYEGDVLSNIVVDGKKAWLSSAKDIEDLADAVKTFTSLGKDNTIASVSGFEENMADGDIKVFVNVADLMAMGGGMGEQTVNRELSRYGISASDVKLKELCSSHLFATVAFEKDKMTCKVKVLDDAGNNVMAKMLGDKTVDIDMLKHFDKSTTMVYASVLPDYVKKMYAAMLESSIYDETQKGIVEEVFKNLDDNVAVGISLKENLMRNDTSLWGNVHRRFDHKALGITLVAKCKRDLGAEVATLGSILNLDIAEDGSVAFPVDGDMVVRVKTDGKYLVASNWPAPTQPLVDPGVFKGRATAMFVNLSKGSPASKGISKAFGIDLNLDLTAISYSDKNNNVFEVKVNNNKQENVLAYLIDLVLKLSMI